MDFIHRRSQCPKWLKYLIIFWSLIGASAIEVRCGKPGRASIGRYTPELDSYPVGSTVKYACESPRLISKPHQRICQGDGTWSTIIPICYNRIVVQQFLHSSTLRDMTPAKAVDNDLTTCFSTAWEKDGYWVAILPSPSTVTAVMINFPVGNSMNVQVIVKEENSGEVICIMQDYSGQSTSGIFYCPENTRGMYVHVRDHSSVEHFFEICEVAIYVRPVNPCLTPDVPYNGFGNMMITAPEREYSYFCNEGYSLLGAKKSFCRANGIWAPTAPVCYRIQCITTASPENGSVRFDDDGGVVPYHRRANYSCNPGFALHGSSTRFCIGWNKWSGEEPTCIAKRCGQVTRVANGELVVNSTTIRSTAILVCNDGYQPLSDSLIECLPSGLWSHASLICAPIRCDPNPTIPHGSFRLLANSTFYGSRLQVTCDQGYVVRNNGLRMCERDGQWEDLTDVCIEIVCESVQEEIPERGVWHPLNHSFRSMERPIRVLKCHPGYHIVGTPPIVRCLENGSWSFTNATCMRTPEAIMSTGDWTPNVMLSAAVAVGAGTAICIVCMVATFHRIRKRRHMRTNAAVFHVGMSNRPTFCDTPRGIPLSPEEHYYTSAMYEELAENADYEKTKPRRPCSGFELPKSRKPNVGYETTKSRKPSAGYEKPKPRKPSVGLPLLPLDTDPVYAQPFETESSTSAVENKSQRGDFGSREDPYSGHIYAEPIDSRRPPSGSSTVSGCVAETWFRGGSTVKMSRKMSLPDCQQIPKAGSDSSEQRIKVANRTSSTASLCVEGTEKRQSQDFTGRLGDHTSNSISNGSLGLFAELQSNSIYLRTGDQDLRPVSSGYRMADNDIYLDEYFSNV